MNKDFRLLANIEIEQQIVLLEEQYTAALKEHADVHTLSSIWSRIKDLKHELKQRSSKS